MSKISKDDKRLTGWIKQAWFESGYVYGYHKLHDDLPSEGEIFCSNRVARLTNLAGIKAQIGYRRQACDCCGQKITSRLQDGSA
ncbi:MAG: transposase [Aliivibrio sp.]|nr:transposase [Aliivibrio sp.]